MKSRDAHNGEGHVTAKSAMSHFPDIQLLFFSFSVFSFFSVFSVFLVFSIFGTPLDLSESYCFFSFFSVSSFFQFFSVFGTPLDLSDFFYVCSFFSENVGTCTGSMPATIRTSSKYISTLGLKNTVKNDARNRPQTIYI